METIVRGLTQLASPAFQSFRNGLAGGILAKVLSRDTFTTIANHAVEHPIQFTVQSLGGVSMFASAIMMPVLGVLGFSAAGPVAGSTAAGVQSSMGLVQAGSWFSWAQSAAMGGSAAGGIVTGMFSGAGVAGAATWGPALGKKVVGLVATLARRD